MLVPVAQQQTRFVVPGLSADVRGIVLGPETGVLLPSLDRVVAALRALTALVELEDLYVRLRIQRVRSSLGTVEFLLRHPSADVNVIDRVARIAALHGGEVLTGDGRHFVRYRDRASPLGYDVDRLAEAGEGLLLYGRIAEGAYAVEESWPLATLILRLRPEPLRHPLPAGDTVLLLARPGLRKHVEGYLWRREVPTEVARLEGPEGGWLYRLRGLPQRSLELFGRTPGLTAYLPLTDRAAVAWGFEHPLELRVCGVALEDRRLHLFDGRRAGARILEEAPAWVPLREAVRPELADLLLPARAAEPGPPTAIPLRLVPDPAALATAAALFVPAAHLGLFAGLVYRLPPAALERYRAASLSEGVIVLGPGGLEDLPVGVPLRTWGASVYLPIGHALLPRLAPALVGEALGVEPARLYFFPAPGQAPFSVAEAAFTSLDRAFLTPLLARPAPAGPQGEAPDEVRIAYAAPGAFPLWNRRFARLPPDRGPR